MKFPNPNLNFFEQKDVHMDMPKAIYPFNFFKVGSIMRFCFLLYKHPANSQAGLHTHTLVRVIAACMH